MQLRLFPVSGYGAGPAGHLYYLFLPALTLAISHAPDDHPQPAGATIQVLGSDYIGTARSKGIAGAPRFSRVTCCATRSIPTVTVLGVNLGFLVGGPLVIEHVFAMPGLGSLMINAIFDRDFPSSRASRWSFALLVVLVNLLTDIVLRAARSAGDVRP